MKLELKHFLVYAPYGVEIQRFDGEISNLTEFIYNIPCALLTNFKPILRPLSDLTKKIKIGNKKIIPLTELLRLSNFDVDKMTFREQIEYIEPYKNILFISFLDAQKLLEWHFDVFGLIENNLAIDKNTL